MPVQSIECQLVRAQIGRYLGGEPLSQEAMRQLEVHLVACDDCKEALSSRKAELRAKMSVGASEAKPKQKIDPSTFAQRAVVDYKAIETAVKTASKAPEKPAKVAKPNSFIKPLALTGVLALVLVAMSRMSGGNGLSMGTNAFSAFASNAVSSAKSAVGATDQPKTSVAATKPPVSQPTNLSSTTTPRATGVEPATATTKATLASAALATPKSTDTPSNAKASVGNVPAPPVSTAPNPSTASTTPTATSDKPSNTPANSQSSMAPSTPPADSTPKPAAPPQPESIQKAPAPAPTYPKVAAVHKPKPRKLVHRRTPVVRAHKAHKPVRHRPIARIRVYDASGSPIEP